MSEFSMLFAIWEFANLILQPAKSKDDDDKDSIDGLGLS